MKEFDELVRIMATLRGERGCPWDHRQTHESLIPYLIEEANETVESIESGKPEALCEELGDLMLQIVFHAQIAREAGEFAIEQVLEGINSKLIRRHPHVFGDSTVSSPDDVVKQWNEIKHEEKAGKETEESQSSRGSTGRKETIGRLLSHVVTLASRMGVDPEQALREAMGK
jgi:tetrapyrrole methylase family protein / MazG family protein